MSEVRTVRAGRIAFAILLAACGGGAESIPVEIKQFEYVPARFQAHKGDTLVITNHDVVPHTATAKNRSWDSGTIAPDSTLKVVVGEAGDFYCTFHPTMLGAILK